MLSEWIMHGETEHDMWAVDPRRYTDYTDHDHCLAKALETYGRELGLAFQLVDDALDYGGASAKLGKSTGDDFREGKVTLPVALAIAAASGEESAFWTRVIAEGEQVEGDFDQAVRLIRAHGALEATVNQARTHARRAREALAIFPDNKWRTALVNLADFVVDRAY